MRSISCIRNVVRSHIHDGYYSGAAIYALTGGKLAIEHYDGHIRDDNRSPAGDHNTLWPVASITKLYTAATIMALVEHGDLALDTRISEIVPQFSGIWREEIRLGHLLTHTGGMMYQSPKMAERLQLEVPLAEITSEMLGLPLKTRPGATVSYADYHYLMAAHLAEVVTGKSFAQLLHELVLEPMGLGHTFFPAPTDQDFRIATIRGSEAGMYNTRYARGLAHSAFAAVATASDIAKFLSHFAPNGPRALKEETVKLMTTDQTGMWASAPFRGVDGYVNAGPRRWGYGFALQTEDMPELFSNHASFSTFGHSAFSGCQAFVDPEKELIVVVCTNTHWNTDPRGWEFRMRELTNSTVLAAMA